MEYSGDPEDRFALAYGLSPTGAALVRPDGFVGWRAQAMMDDPRGAIAQALGAILDDMKARATKIKGFLATFLRCSTGVKFVCCAIDSRTGKETTMTRPFEGIRVIDVTHVLAGPFAAYQLAVLGADVIKVEHPDDPDQSRGSGTDKALNRRQMGTAS